jgi:hypothetical protein
MIVRDGAVPVAPGMRKPVTSVTGRFRQRGRIVPGIVKRLQHAPVRHGKRIVEGAVPISHQP